MLWFLCIFFGLLDQFCWQSPFPVAHFGWWTLISEANFSWLVKSGCQNSKLAGNTFPPFPSFWSPAKTLCSFITIFILNTHDSLNNLYDYELWGDIGPNAILYLRHGWKSCPNHICRDKKKIVQACNREVFQYFL